VATARTCLVTGAGRGIGRAVALRLAARGHRVALTARSEDELAATAAACGGATCLVVPADLTAEGAVDHVFEVVERDLGPVEILVANAGAAASAPLHRTDDAMWRNLMEINLDTPFRCVRRAVPAMTDAGYGRIVAIASIASRVGAPYLAAYTAAKHGLLGLVRAAGVELAGTGVTVNAVCPAYVDTPMTDESVARVVRRTGRDEESVRRWFERQQPIGRLVTADEVADAVLLCVDNAAMTASSVAVDGGAVQL
jgi:NAD(P)-dependent dehydrogenase (short-subunit alcohol dehydrogenase family)